MSTTKIAAAALVALGLATGALALQYDQDATPNVIVGTGIGNGGFTVDRENGVELALRARLRFNAANLPEDTWNSNGDGSYSFAAGPPPAGGFGFCSFCPTTPIWNFDWSVNTDFAGGSGLVLSSLTYELSLDGDPTCGTSALVFDPITPGGSFTCWDHSVGDNSTPGSGGAETNCGAVGADAAYASSLATSVVAQNSWNYEFFNGPGPLATFDPSVDGTYEITLRAFDAAGNVVASTTIKVVVGAGGNLDTDGDGICDSLDACPSSIVGPTVVVAGCDTGIANGMSAEGCTLSDELAECAASGDNHGANVSCIAHLTAGLVRSGRITGAEKGAIVRCAARANH